MKYLIRSLFVTILTFLFSFSSRFAKEQKLNESAFIRAIGVTEQDEACFDMTQDLEGNFWLTGHRNNESLVLQILPDGAVNKQQSYNFTFGNDFTRFVEVDSDGMIIINGRDQPNSPTENFIFKLNPQTAEIIWSKKYLEPAMMMEMV